MRIEGIRAREVVNSRGYPTVEVELRSGETLSRAMAPSGASTGSHEAHEVRDGGARLLGKGVRTACRNVEEVIAKRLLGARFDSFRDVDRALLELEPSPQKATLGANAILSVSLAAAKLQAALAGLPLYRVLAEGQRPCLLPIPFLNIFNGGAHADNGLDVQEFMIVPIGFHRFSEALFASAEVFHALRLLLKERGYRTLVADEGGFGPNLKSEQETLDTLVGAIAKAGHEPGRDFGLALDVAGGEFVTGGIYRFPKSGKETTADELIQKICRWARDYPLISVEDPLGEDDWEGWRALMERAPEGLQIVGDDLFVTQPQRLHRGIEEGVANAILIKPNQVGTVSETLDVIALAKEHNYRCMVSHRSGETEDVSIAHLAVAAQTGQIKAGAPCRGERTCKYNELLRIEDELGEEAVYASWTSLPRRAETV